MTNYFFANRNEKKYIKCLKCYNIYCCTEFYKKYIMRKIIDDYNQEYDFDMNHEFEYWIKRVNIECQHNRCVIM